MPAVRSRRARTLRAGAAAALVALTLSAAVGCSSDSEEAGVTTTVTSTTAPVDHDHAPDPEGPLGTSEAPDGRTLVDTNGELIEVTRFELDAAPTAAQRRAARRFASEVADATTALPDVAAAAAAGYQRWEGVDQWHWVHLDHVADGRVLDPARPEFLMYDDDGVLLGVMFLPSSAEARGPQVAGPLTRWHYHLAGPSCWEADGLLPATELPDEQGRCSEGLRYGERSPEMLHVWTVDHPHGPFASAMPDHAS
jgi:hypothetical protein